MLWLVMTVTAAALWTPASANYTVRVGVIMVEASFLPWTIEMVGPALDMAFEVSSDVYGIHFDRYNRYNLGFCDPEGSVGHLADLYNDYQIEALVGPGCSQDININGMLATYYQIPQVTGLGDLVLEKESWPVLTRLSYSLEKQSGYVSDLYHAEDIQALIGPGCSGDISVCGKLATYYDLPHVTGVGDLVLGKQDYPTLTRLSYSLEKQSGFLISILSYFDWWHVAIVYDTNDVLMNIQGNALRTALREDPDYPRPYDIEFDTTKDPDFEEMLLEVSKYARVILFLSSGDDLRNFMLTAYDLGYCNGDYAFMTIELFRSVAWGDFSWLRGDSRDEDAKAAFESLFILSLTEPSGPTWEAFSEEIIVRAARDYNYTYQEEVNYFVGAFYNSVIYLARAYNATLEDGEDPTNGLAVAQKGWNTTFMGIMGEVFIDDIGDRIADYSLLDMTDTEEGIFTSVAYYYGAGQYLDMVAEIQWPGDATGPPPDVPACGFQNDDPSCSEEMMIIIIVSVLLAVVIIGSTIGGLIYRRMKFESELANMAWRVKWEDVVLMRGRAMASTSRLSLAALESEDGSMHTQQQIFAKIGNYKGMNSAVRRFELTKITLDRAVLLELKQMRDAQFDNLARFIGACVEPGSVAVLFEYCPKGSLVDILTNDSIKLDWTFRYSLINDIIAGMCYMHGGDLKVHGRLKSSNCVVDSRFVLKLTDYGLPSFYYGIPDSKLDPGNPELAYRSKFWRAPELLSVEGPADQHGDIYSFGIILSEIITRKEPYEDMDMDPEEVIQQVMTGTTPPTRPRMERDSCDPPLFNLTELCWAEDRNIRPTFPEIKSAMRGISKKELSGNILDNLLSRMEQYAENLESLVEDRTRAFLDEKKKSEELLYRVLPRSIAEQLKRGRPVESEAYECVTIYFSDIVGFTALSARSEPEQVIDLLNDLYTCFDGIIDTFDVYKVETIGDAYMVVSGLPIKNGNEHARQIARMSLALLTAVKTFTIRHLPEETLKLRIGCHSGSCCAGVVGLTMPRYCLFGDTVNTASRMESNGEACRIHVSPTTKKILERYNSFLLPTRGEVNMKGKETMVTYWLEGEVE